MDNYKDNQRTIQLLAQCQLTVGEVKSFSFMTRYTPEPQHHSVSNKYGAGLLTLHTVEGKDVCLILKPRHHPESVVRALMAQGIPFDNLRTVKPSDGRPVKAEKYARFSLNMFWHTAMFLICMAGGIAIWARLDCALLAAIVFFLGASYLYGLLFRFRYVQMDSEGIRIRSLAGTARFAYRDLLKVNFDFAREPNFTYVMEVLDRQYNYYLFYIGRTPRKSLNEIASRLCAQGVDATCSLNDEKHHYGDIYHVQ